MHVTEEACSGPDVLMAIEHRPIKWLGGGLREELKTMNDPKKYEWAEREGLKYCSPYLHDLDRIWISLAWETACGLQAPRSLTAYRGMCYIATRSRSYAISLPSLSNIQDRVCHRRKSH